MRSLYLRLILAGCVLGFGAAEAAARLWFFGTSVNGLAREREQWLAGGGPLTGFSERAQDGATFRLHPLFGYVGIPGKLAVNKFGFFSGREIELAGDRLRVKGAAPNALVVGIFGGSLALQVASEERLFEARLAPLFPGREVVVVNFAMPGYAAPQTLAVYQYFRDVVNVALFLDGLNEIWNPVRNNRLGFPPVFAKAEHFRLMSPEGAAEREEIVRLRHRLRLAAERSLIPLWRNLALAHALWKVEERYSGGRIRELALAERGADPFFPSGDPAALGVFEWELAHDQAAALAGRQRQRFLHFLQPTAVTGRKRLTAEESEAVKKMPELPQLVERAYPLLEESARRRGVRSLTGLFDGVAEPVWIDVAHLNEQGIRLVQAELVRGIGELGRGRR